LGVYFTNFTLLLDQKTSLEETARISSILYGSSDAARSPPSESTHFLATFDAKKV
jgi:hypothetical protein